MYQAAKLMTIGQVIASLVLIIALGGAMLYYSFRYSPTTQSGKECIETATVVPLVNTSTAMGITGAISECE